MCGSVHVHSLDYSWLYCIPCVCVDISMTLKNWIVFNFLQGVKFLDVLNLTLRHSMPLDRLWIKLSWNIIFYMYVDCKLLHPRYQSSTLMTVRALVGYYFKGFVRPRLIICCNYWSANLFIADCNWVFNSFVFSSWIFSLDWHSEARIYIIRP